MREKHLGTTIFEAEINEERNNYLGWCLWWQLTIRKRFIVLWIYVSNMSSFQSWKFFRSSLRISRKFVIKELRYSVRKRLNGEFLDVVVNKSIHRCLATFSLSDISDDFKNIFALVYACVLFSEVCGYLYAR